MTADEVRSGKCACGEKCVLTTRLQKKDETVEYNAFCVACLGDAEGYLKEKVQEFKEAA